MIELVKRVLQLKEKKSKKEKKKSGKKPHMHDKNCPKDCNGK